ncbi:MAG: hypothetical protein JXR14_03085 [Paracoccaceae bacterium]
MVVPFEFSSPGRQLITVIGIAASVFLLILGLFQGDAPLFWWVIWGAFSSIMFCTPMLEKDAGLTLHADQMIVKHGQRKIVIPYDEIKQFRVTNWSHTTAYTAHMLDGSVMPLPADSFPGASVIGNELERRGVAFVQA